MWQFYTWTQVMLLNSDGQERGSRAATEMRYLTSNMDIDVGQKYTMFCFRQTLQGVLFYTHALLLKRFIKESVQKKDAHTFSKT